MNRRVTRFCLVFASRAHELGVVTGVDHNL